MGCSRTNRYPGTGQNGMLYSIQRNSDRNYAMRATCLDGAGARYVTYKRAHVLCKVVAWLPPTNLNDHAPDASVVDCCHASLLVPGTNSAACTLTAAALLHAVSPSTKCLFVNCFSNDGRGFACAGYAPGAVAASVAATQGGLQCVGLSECPVGRRTLEALAAGCPDLRGLTFSMCTAPQKPEAAAPPSTYPRMVNDADDAPSDALLAAVLRACPHLEWLLVDVEGGHFGDACWRALASGCCPALKVGARRRWSQETTHTKKGGGG